MGIVMSNVAPYGIFIDNGCTITGDTVDEVLGAWFECFALDMSTPQRVELELLTRPRFCRGGCDDVSSHTCNNHGLHDVDYGSCGKPVLLPLLLSYTSVTAIELIVDGDSWRLLEPHEEWINNDS
jgi:hypothetical protein